MALIPSQQVNSSFVVNGEIINTDDGHLTISNNKDLILIDSELQIFDLYPRQDGKIEAILRSNGHTSNDEPPLVADQASGAKP
jgi:hypothetical protein